MTYYQDVDDGILYAELVPIYSEWVKVFHDNGDNFGKFQMWSKCNSQGLIRSYYYIDSNPNIFQFVNPNHAKVINNGLVIYSNDIKVDTNYTRAGGEMYLNISTFLTVASDASDFIAISIQGFTKYIKIPFEVCSEYFHHHKRSLNDVNIVKTSSKSLMSGYIMSLWTYDYLEDVGTVHKIRASIAGLAKHLEFHCCLLNITRYEVLVQGSYVKYYLQHPVISEAVKSGRFKFLIKNNHFTQYNETIFPDDCKYYSVFMNIQILRYWTHDARLFLFDTDEYINTSPLLLQELRRLIRTKSVISFQRKGVICLDCNATYPDHLHSFDNHTYGQSEQRSLAKVVLNPNEAGLMLIHFPLVVHGEKVRLDSRIAYLCHFENYYNRRISVDNNLYKRNQLTNLQSSCRNSDYWLNRYLIEHGNVVASFYFQFEMLLLVCLTTVIIISIFFRGRLYKAMITSFKYFHLH